MLTIPSTLDPNSCAKTHAAVTSLTLNGLHGQQEKTGLHPTPGATMETLHSGLTAKLTFQNSTKNRLEIATRCLNMPPLTLITSLAFLKLNSNAKVFASQATSGSSETLMMADPTNLALLNCMMTSLDPLSVV